MSEQWQNNTLSSTTIKDDDDAPNDWEAELEEKPKVSVMKEKPKSETTTTKTKINNNKSTDEKESSKIIQQTDGNSPSEELDDIQKKEQLEKEHEKLNMASELINKQGVHQSLDNMNLISRDEFLNYSLRLSNHLDIVSKSEFYPEFIDHFLNGITKSMSSENIKRLSATLQAIILRKQSEERERKTKSKPKNKSKPQLTTGRRTDYGAFGDEDQDFDHDMDYDDDDDFM